jgi:hypothetical protein
LLKNNKTMKLTATFFLFLTMLLSNGAYAQYTKQWTLTYNSGTSTYDNPAGLALDTSDRSAYVLGRTYMNGTTRTVLLKYHADNATLIWTRKEDSLASPAGVALSKAGDIYIWGVKPLTGGNQTFSVIKYTSSGIQQWNRTSDDALSKGFYQAGVLLTDAAEDVYVGGPYASNTVSNSGILIKYDKSGNKLWTRLTPDTTGYGTITALHTDAQNNLYVLCSDFSLLKYTPQGTLLWETKPFPGQPFYCNANKLVMDNSGNCYIFGFINSSTIGYRLVKINSLGVIAWIKSDFPTFAGFGDHSYGIALDRNASNIYVSGVYDTSSVSFEAVYKVETQAGTTGGKLSDSLYYSSDCILVDKNDNLLLAGAKYTPGKYQLALAQYDANGLKTWEDVLLLQNQMNVTPHSIIMDKKDLLILATLSDSYSDILLARYKSPLSGIRFPESPKTGCIVYPNPLSASSLLCMEEPVSSGTYLSVVDITGREVWQSPVKGRFTPINDIQAPPGMYFYIVRNPEKVLHTGKLIVK